MSAVLCWSKKCHRQTDTIIIIWLSIPTPIDIPVYNAFFFNSLSFSAYIEILWDFRSHKKMILFWQFDCEHENVSQPSIVLKRNLIWQTMRWKENRFKGCWGFVAAQWRAGTDLPALSARSSSVPTTTKGAGSLRPLLQLSFLPGYFFLTSHIGNLLVSWDHF